MLDYRVLPELRQESQVPGTAAGGQGQTGLPWVAETQGRPAGIALVEPMQDNRLGVAGIDRPFVYSDHVDQPLIRPIPPLVRNISVVLPATARKLHLQLSCDTLPATRVVSVLVPSASVGPPDTFVGFAAVPGQPRLAEQPVLVCFPLGFMNQRIRGQL